MFAAELGDVVLNLARAGGNRVNLSGRVLARRVLEPPVAVHLLGGGAERMTLADELGEFAFEAVPAGTYELVAAAGDAEIVIEAAELSA